LQTLSNNTVYSQMYLPQEQYDMAHMKLAEFADAFVIVPATANIIGKIASGIADDLLSTTIMATDKPVLICPAMNDKMLANPIVQENINKLKKYKYVIMESGVGELACKTQGAGRLPEVPEIVEEIERLLTPQTLAGEKILITAGPTEEPLDPVRYITNLSSGKMGYALARVARRKGAQVTLISGPTDLPLPMVENIIKVRTALEMYQAVIDNYEKYTVIIKAAAVADYRPKLIASGKIKKDDTLRSIELTRNPDIIAEVGKNKKNIILVGFAMETEDLLANAQEKLKKKNMDLIIANSLREEGAGFQTDTNKITIIDREGEVQSLPLMTKIEAAEKILEKIAGLLKKKGGPNK
jgi:phosphopantothenoylcysteine decarboxylase / phosphopantothenate---cysteine ligase